MKRQSSSLFIDTSYIIGLYNSKDEDHRICLEGYEISKAYRQFYTTDAILLENHGALTLGQDLLSAYHLMETLEHAAHIVSLAIQLGNVQVLPKDQVDKLMSLRENFGMTGKVTTCSTQPKEPSSKPVTDATIENITRKVMERLKNR